jgi:uncharacterized protein (DUF4415 family)
MKNKSTEMKSKTDWNRLHSMKDDEIDFSDIPKIDPDVFKKMIIRMPRRKELVSIRIDPDVLGWFRKQGRRYQTRINAVLRSYVEARSH